jgi:N-acylneuraminate cytidylyltransferase
MVSGRAIAIIPARGGSKRIPRKNVVDFFGKPMMAWTVEAALQSGIFGTVLVSTDDAGIAETAKRFGAEAPFLREAHADDTAPSSLATLAALEQMERYTGESFETVVQLMPNCPLRGADDIARAVGNFRAHDAPMQISCVRFGWMNPWWAASLDGQGRPSPKFPDALSRRSQELDPLYCPTGAIWVAKAAALRQAQTFYGEGHVYFPLDWKAGIDIDDAQDLEMAKAAFALIHGARQEARG